MKKVMIDMDGVLANFYKAAKQALIDNPNQKYPQSQWGFFLKLEEIPRAIESVKLLQTKYDVWILTRPSFRNVNCFTEKAQWIWDKFGYEMVPKIIMAGDKSMIKGDYLIDDMDNAGQAAFEGEWIHFGSEKFRNWESVVEYLMDLPEESIGLKKLSTQELLDLEEGFYSLKEIRKEIIFRLFNQENTETEIARIHDYIEKTKENYAELQKEKELKKLSTSELLDLEEGVYTLTEIRKEVIFRLFNHENTETEIVQIKDYIQKTK